MELECAVVGRYQSLAAREQTFGRIVSTSKEAVHLDCCRRAAWMAHTCPLVGKVDEGIVAACIVDPASLLVHSTVDYTTLVY